MRAETGTPDNPMRSLHSIISLRGRGDGGWRWPSLPRPPATGAGWEAPGEREKPLGAVLIERARLSRVLCRQRGALN